MDWPATIEKLLSNGWTQKRLAESCGCAQATISDLARGKTADPSYPVGKELERLAARMAAGLDLAPVPVAAAAPPPPPASIDRREAADLPVKLDLSGRPIAPPPPDGVPMDTAPSELRD